MTPVSPLEGAFWDFLPVVVWWITAIGALVTTVFLFLAWRLSRRTGFIVFALGFGFATVAMLVGFISTTSTDVSSIGEISVSRKETNIGPAIIFALAAVGAGMLYREERKSGRKTAEPGATDNPDYAQRLREDH